MKPDDRHASEMPLRIVLIVSFTTALVAFIVAVERAPQRREAQPAFAPQGIVEPTGAPIAAEAETFRAQFAMYAIDPAAHRERAAHPRTLATYRALRAYPGAPPRIPHGFTADEFRTGACKTCHERGGFSPRFGAYVPVTPHPEMGACLQCHVGNDAVTGVSLPMFDASARCRQCHALSGQRGTSPGIDWRTTEWPRLAARTPDRGPPPIPHDLNFRGSCLACHAGPAAVAEIRTPHPERPSCRQCHVTLDADAGRFTRAAGGDGGAGGTQ